MAQAPPSPSPKPSPTETNVSSGSSTSKQQHRSSSSSNAMSSGNAGQSSGLGQYGSSSSQGQSSSSKKGRSSGHDSSSAAAAAAAQNAAAMQFAGLQGLNPNFLSSLPQLGAFDPKNPLFMPFAGMQALAGMGGLGGNMNLFANLAGMGMDPQALAAMLAASGANLGNLDGTSSRSLGKSSSSGGNSKSRKSESSTSQQLQQQQLQQQSSSASSQSGQQQSSSSKTPTSSSSAAAAAASSAAAMSAAASSAFPFYLPNNLLYSPLGLGGINPYSGMSAYDQLAQQYLLNGVGLSSGATTSTSTSSPSTSNVGSRQSNTKSSSSRNTSLQGSSQNQTSSPSGSSKHRSSMSSSAAAREAAQLQNLLLPHDAHLLESLSRVTGLDIAQSSRGSSDKKSSRGGDSGMLSSSMSSKDLERERKKIMENLSRSGFPPDLAAMQAFAQGKLPSSMGGGSSSSKNSKDQMSQLPPIPPELSQALFTEMAAQAAAAAAAASGSSGGSKRAREQEMKDVFEQLSKSQVELFARNLGMGSTISLIPTSSGGGTSTNSSPMPEEPKSKRSRHDTSHHQQQQQQQHQQQMQQLQQQQQQLQQQMLAHEQKDSGALSLVTNDDNKSSNRSRGDGNSSSSAGIDKVNLSPAAAASIASLPSQTTITIAPSGSDGGQSSSHTSPMKSPGSHSVVSDKNSVHQQEMDIEDLIAPSKVSKGGGLVLEDEQHQPLKLMHESPKEMISENIRDYQESDKSFESNGGNNEVTSDGCESTGDKKGKRSSRSKRPRSGEELPLELSTSSVPERKRELRSSAGRSAAAAAQRMALEAKAAAESLNLSTGSNESLPNP